MARRWSTIPVALYALLLVCRATSPAAADSSIEPGAAGRLFRLAFSSGMFTEVNENDAKASMKLWLKTVAQERGIPVDPDAIIYRDVDAIDRSLRSHLPDGIGLTTDEYWQLSNALKFDRLVVAVTKGRIEEEYVVLARRDSRIADVGELRGRSLLVLRTPRMSLAMVWLDTLLLQKGLAPAAEYVSRVTYVKKPVHVVLPVFFRQADACIVTRRHFETMSELNPQIGKQLSVVALSPDLVPSMFAFLASITSPFKDLMLTEMKRLSDSPAGQQLLTLLQADSIEERPFSCLDKSVELISTYHRLGLARRESFKMSGKPAAADYRSSK